MKFESFALMERSKLVCVVWLDASEIDRLRRGVIHVESSAFVRANCKFECYR
jgi:hypothetical protein